MELNEISHEVANWTKLYGTLLQCEKIGTKWTHAHSTKIKSFDRTSNPFKDTGMQNVIEKPLKMVPIRNKKLSQFAAVQNEKICETYEFEGTISTIWTENKSQ